MADFNAAMLGGMNVKGQGQLPSVSSSANPFSAAPAGTKRIVMSIRAFPVYLSLDGTAATSTNGVDYPVGTYELDVNPKLLADARMLQNGGVATGSLIFLG